MSSIYPSFVNLSSFYNNKLNYIWDDYDPYKLIPKNSDETEQIISQISNRAKFIFSLGCAEWVVSRISSVVKIDQRAWNYIDALWAYALSDKYLLPKELDYDNWLGKNYGPICLSLTTVVNTVYGFDEDNAEIDAAFAEQVALYVLEGNSSFICWKQMILSGMMKSFHVALPSSINECIFREFLDPNINIDFKKVKEMNFEQLLNINIKSNPYIRLKKSSME